MKNYYVEGLFISRKNVNKKKGSSPAAREIEPFARSFWAETPAEALQQATEALDGGQWWGTPRVSSLSEEQRMRQSGAPELPGFALAAPGKKPKPAGQ